MKLSEVKIGQSAVIRQSAIAVCYVYKVTGGAAKFREKAEKRGLQIIDVQN